MKKYIAIILINSEYFKTVVFAESPLHAKILLEYKFGIGSVLKTPIVTDNQDEEEILKDSTIGNRKPNKPLSPAQAKIENLKQQKDIANRNLKAERDRQKIAKAQKTIRQVNLY
jgi:hypothetical protein